jgi:hypothetical protein
MTTNGRQHGRTMMKTASTYRSDADPSEIVSPAKLLPRKPSDAGRTTVQPRFTLKHAARSQPRQRKLRHVSRL